jgi:hypothetical protein
MDHISARVASGHVLGASGHILGASGHILGASGHICSQSESRLQKGRDGSGRQTRPTVDVEEPIQVRDGEKAAHLVGAVSKDQPVAGALGAHMRREQHSEAGGVDDVESGQVDRDVSVGVLDGVVKDRAHMPHVAHV